MYFLREEPQDEVFLSNDVNISFKAFMNTFLYYFNTAFPIKTSHVNNNNKNKWLTIGLLVSKKQNAIFK